MRLSEQALKRRRARKKLRRMQRWQFGLRLVLRARSRARYGISLPGEKPVAADDRRRLRNARKQERRAAR